MGGRGWRGGKFEVEKLAGPEEERFSLRTWGGTTRIVGPALGAQW